jgi:hypothetical protein
MKSISIFSSTHHIGGKAVQNNASNGCLCPAACVIRLYLFITICTLILFPLSSLARQITQNTDCRLSKLKSTYSEWWNCDSSVSQYYEASSGLWVNGRKFEYTYDDHRNEVLAKDYTWNTDAGKWEHRGNTVKIYDTAANSMTRYDSIWGDWLYYSKADELFNDDGINILTIYYQWKENEGTWTKESKVEYGADTIDHKKHTSYYRWDTISNQWRNSYLVEALYNDDGKEMQEVTFIWNDISGQWENYTQYEWDYNTIGYVRILSDWNSAEGQWMNYEKFETAFDVDGNMSWRIFYDWNKTDSLWIENIKDMYTYDANGNQIITDRCRWNETSGQWEPEIKTIYYYSRHELLRFPDQINPSMKIYPVPVVDFITVDLDDPNAIMELYDMQGKKVLTRQLNRGNSHVPVHHLKDGVYLYVIYGRERMSGKVTIRR